MLLELGVYGTIVGHSERRQKWETNEVVAANPSLADVYYYRAMVYLNKQQNPQAKADLQKLLELDPNNKFAKDAKDFLKELK